MQSAPIKHRFFREEKLVLASHNGGKLKEISAMLAPYAIEVSNLAMLGLGEVEETGKSFAENARLKACAASQATGMVALADDSGLEADALGGLPGIHTADWAEVKTPLAGPDMTASGAADIYAFRRDFNHAMEKLHKALTNSGDKNNRHGRFVSCLCLAWPDGHTETFTGTVEGTLIWPLRGTQGFGFDPMFVPIGEKRSFAEMDPAEKETHSHRRRAFQSMIEACFDKSC